MTTKYTMKQPVYKTSNYSCKEEQNKKGTEQLLHNIRRESILHNTMYSTLWYLQH